MNKIYKIIGIGVTAALLGVIGYYAMQQDRAVGLSPPAAPMGNMMLAEDEASLDQAQAIVEVVDLAINGNIISFTIPADARAQDEEASAVTVSGIYATDKGNTEDCPVLSSAEVSKDVQDYEPMSGQAHVTATFDDEAAAQEVFDKGCLLINDAG